MTKSGTRWRTGGSSARGLRISAATRPLTSWWTCSATGRTAVSESCWPSTRNSLTPTGRGEYGPPSLADIGGEWIVLSDRTQINPGSLGELRQSVRGLYSVPFNETTKRVVMTATVTAPEQPVVTLAKWDVRGIRQVLSHCEAIRP